MSRPPWDSLLTRVPAPGAGGLDSDGSLALAVRLDQREGRRGVHQPPLCFGETAM
ncbi:hypothetical protein [Arachnia propionica]|uniref:hypothetical protein n=1 Tax=Arachnia propionica TaxID=1750 RepID=UPI00163A8E2A|nr:hypothetical protein [Arachnia propionica]